MDQKQHAELMDALHTIGRSIARLESSQEAVSPTVWIFGLFMTSSLIAIAVKLWQ